MAEAAASSSSSVSGGDMNVLTLKTHGLLKRGHKAQVAANGKLRPSIEEVEARNDESRRSVEAGGGAAGASGGGRRVDVEPVSRLPLGLALDCEAVLRELAGGAAAALRGHADEEGGGEAAVAGGDTRAAVGSGATAMDVAPARRHWWHCR